MIAAETDFSGVVRVDRDGSVELVKAFGLAHRGYQVPNTVDTQFGMASGGKTLTAGGGEPDRRRRTRIGHDRSIGARSGPAADRP